MNRSRHRTRAAERKKKPSEPGITAAVLTRNEESNIQACLATILWCDEIILIDHSSDTTLARAKEIVPSEKLRIDLNPQEKDFSLLRNRALKLAEYEWVFFVDADHRVPKALAKEIRERISRPSLKEHGFFIKQLDIFEGRRLIHGETGHIAHLRLGKKAAGQWQRRVHEYWKIPGPTALLKNSIYHYPHQTVSEFLDHINRWSTLDAMEFRQSGSRGRLWKVIGYPFAKFMQNYVLRLGFLDGFPGLIAAWMMSLHSASVRIKMMESQ